MQRLKHPVRAIREPFGKAGLIVAAIALIFALTGGALAASGNNPLAAASKAKQGKPGKPGKNGKNGKDGAPGATGPAGPAGAAGKDGANGTNGANGAPGAPGKSVTLVNEEPAACPNEEGLTYEVEGSGDENEVCNGEPGPAGPSCSTVTHLCELPSGATMTGAWLNPAASGGFFSTVISFPFYYAPSGLTTKFLKVGETAAGECEGTAAAPSAAAGVLCIYTVEEESLFNGTPFLLGEGHSGAYVKNLFSAKGVAAGTWAVTAP